jgi:tRNA/rRNA methyltransferase
MSDRGIPPVVILVEPQLAENIGTAARAMLNCGLTDLRLVKPRDPFPSERAIAASVGALDIMPPVRIFDSTEAAVADLQMVYATTARERKMVKPILTPRAVGEKAVEAGRAGRKVGILFGRERTGLEKDDIALAEAVITVPLNPEFTSLNLAQAVLLIGYEWFTAADDTAPSRMDTVRGGFATQEELQGLYDHLAAELDASGFFHNVEPKRGAILRNLRSVLQRVPLAAQEVNTFRGMLKAIAQGRPLRAPYSKRRQQAEKADDPTSGGSDPAG